MSLSWLVVGGGIHGVHIAARLMGEARVEPDSIRIVDPSEELLHRWRVCTATTGMSHLRSPAVHNLDLCPRSLQRFARKYKGRRPFAPPYSRPSLELFNAHSTHVMKTFGLSDLHIVDRVLSCAVNSDGVDVQLGSGRALAARRVVLAIGATDRPRWPDWASRNHARIQHIFASNFDGWPARSSESVAVVGGGISAAQSALRLQEEGHRVHLVCRHALRQHQFDSDPGWLGPKHMQRFNRERDVDRRRALIANARYAGSVPPDTRRALRRAIEGQGIIWHEAEVEALESAPERLVLRLTTETTIEVQRVLLATGFSALRPGGDMVDELIASASLPCASCGYPVVDSTLCWHPGIYVSGPLAELELGPVSRNIAGARRAGDRLVLAARRSP